MTIPREPTWMPAWRMRELIGRTELSPIEVSDRLLARAEELGRALRGFWDLDGARARAKAAEDAVRAGAISARSPAMPATAER